MYNTLEPLLPFHQSYIFFACRRENAVGDAYLQSRGGISFIVPIYSYTCIYIYIHRQVRSRTAHVKRANTTSIGSLNADAYKICIARRTIQNVQRDRPKNFLGVISNIHVQCTIYIYRYTSAAYHTRDCVSRHVYNKLRSSGTGRSGYTEAYT